MVKDLKSKILDSQKFFASENEATLFIIGIHFYIAAIANFD